MHRSSVFSESPCRFSSALPSRNSARSPVYASRFAMALKPLKFTYSLSLSDGVVYSLCSLQIAFRASGVISMTSTYVRRLQARECLHQESFSFSSRRVFKLASLEALPQETLIWIWYLTSTHGTLNSRSSGWVRLGPSEEEKREYFTTRHGGHRLKGLAPVTSSKTI